MRTGYAGIFAAVLLLCGCTFHTGRAVPENAQFCDNLADRVQSLEQLHLTATTAPAAEETACVQYDPTYAMWFPVMDYAETLQGKDAESFRAEMRRRFQQAADMGINTVYLHVRAYWDAYYASALFPAGEYAGETLDFDPLEIMLEEAHELGLSAHAWINPMRGQTDEGMQQMGTQFPVKQWYEDTEKRGTYLVKSGVLWWLNPAYPEVRQLIADGVREIVAQYPVDGIHLDDYFYPTADAAFDAAAFGASGESDLTQFRLAQTNAMVQQIYQTVKSVNPALQVSISPQGTMHGNYESQFSDVRRWAAEAGYCDVLIPQVYFGFENEVAPFAETTAMWAETVTCPAVSLVVGIGTHKMGREDTWAGSGSQEWLEHSDIPARQVELILSMAQVHGVAIYDYATTFQPETAVEAMQQQVEEIQELLRR